MNLLALRCLVTVERCWLRLIRAHLLAVFLPTRHPKRSVLKSVDLQPAGRIPRSLDPLLRFVREPIVRRLHRTDVRYGRLLRVRLLSDNEPNTLHHIASNLKARAPSKKPHDRRSERYGRRSIEEVRLTFRDSALQFGIMARIDAGLRRRSDDGKNSLRSV